MKTLIPNFTKIRPVEQSCPVMTDGGTNMEKVITAFRNIAKAIQMAKAVCEGLKEGTIKDYRHPGGREGV